MTSIRRHKLASATLSLDCQLNRNIILSGATTSRVEVAGVERPRVHVRLSRLRSDSPVLVHTCEAGCSQITPSCAPGALGRARLLRLRMARASREPYSAQDEALCIVPPSGSCRSRFLGRALCAMLGLVRALMLTTRLYHDVHQFLLSVDVAFHAFSRQLCQR